MADERTNSVAVPCKKKTAVDAFRNSAEGKFSSIKVKEMSKVAEAKKALEAAQAELDAVMKEEKGDIVSKMKDDIVALKLQKGDLRGKAMKQLLGKDYEKVYPSKK